MQRVIKFIKLNMGLLFVAVGIYYFLSVNNIAAGGVSGVAIIIRHYLPNAPIGLIMSIINIVLLVLSFAFIGWEFTKNTVYSSMALSVMVWILDTIYPIKEPIVDDILIQLIFGVVISAVGMAIVFNLNSSTGGTDIIAKLLNMYMSVSIGQGLLFIDFVITLAATKTFGPEKGMYALFGVILNGLVVDNTIDGVKRMKQLVIVSSKSEAIQCFILEKLERGATVYSAKGAYTGAEVDVVTTLITKKESVKLKNYVKSIDPNAFMSIATVNEVLGEGFRH